MANLQGRTILTASTLEGFVTSVLSKNYDDASETPYFHRELWELACDPHPYIAVAAPRAHAKSTAGTLAYGLAMTLFREARYLVVVSDTEGQASMFLQNMRNEIMDNPMIADLFKLRRNEKGLVHTIVDNQTLVIFQFDDGQQFRIEAKGAEQKLRGMLWKGTRPDLILCDDLENDELVMNKERREKLKRWFFGALYPMMSKKGKFRIWGTILHMDSLLESLMPNETSKTCIETPDGLKVYDPQQRGDWKSIKYRAHDSDFKHILWAERFTADSFKKKKEEFLRQGIPDTYSQEYLNHPIDESIAYFKRKDFMASEIADYHGVALTKYITVDLAIGEKEQSDYSVFLVGGLDDARRLHIVDVIRERLDGREIVDLIIKLQQIYRPEVIGIEEMQVSKAIGPFLREEMMKTGVYPSILQLKHGGKDKISRARSIQARVRAKSVVFPKDADWYPIFEDECAKFPRSKHDDQVDAFAYMGMLLDKMVEAPTAYEIEQEEYEEEVIRSEMNTQGRNATTGY